MAFQLVADLHLLLVDTRTGLLLFNILVLLFMLLFNIQKRKVNNFCTIFNAFYIGMIQLIIKCVYKSIS